MGPSNDPELHDLLREWQVPPFPTSLEERVLRMHGRWWGFLLKGSIRVPVPLAVCLAGLMTMLAWELARLTNAPTLNLVMRPGIVEIPASTVGTNASQDGIRSRRPASPNEPEITSQTRAPLRFDSVAPAQQPPISQAQSSPFQVGVGGKMAFEFASVKRNTSGPPPSFFNPNSPGEVPYSNIIPLADDDDGPTNGLFIGTNLTLLNYIGFAYKISGSQVEFLKSQLPKWVWANTENFDIEAQAKGNPTKEQMRLMMQSLLVDRFKLAMHHQTVQLPVFGVILSDPGNTGPGLRPHSDDSPCVNSSGPPPVNYDDKFPIVCGEVLRMNTKAPDRLRFAARNVTMDQIISTLAGFGNASRDLDRPLLDQTGLSSTFDFSIEWMPQQSGAPQAGSIGEPGPTFLEALKDGLGLKLEPQTGPVDALIVDHVEEPSAN
jgi:uncharacterized protein (TIGR03435 family)